MRVLVTGLGRQLGSELCRMLARETVIPKDLTEFDLTRPDCEAQMLAAEPDVILHAGAYTDVDGAKHKPDSVMAVVGHREAGVAPISLAIHYYERLSRSVTA